MKSCHVSCKMTITVQEQLVFYKDTQLKMSAQKYGPVARSPRVGLKNIAEDTGLTKATVSRILAGKDRCPETTRERVREAAKRLGYRPNLLIRGVQTGRSGTIGVMLAIEHTFFAQIAAGIHDELIAHDNVPIILWSNHAPGTTATDKANETEQLHRLVDRRVDAVILCARDDTVGKGYVSEILERGIPLVTVDHQLSKLNVDFVGTDDVMGGRLAAEHLLSLGHKHLAILTGPDEVLLARQRRQGFEDSLRTVSNASCDVYEEKTFDSGQDGPQALLSASPRPTALFVTNDQMVPAVYEVAEQRGLRIPHDLSVVGFGDTFLASLLRPRLTTLQQNPKQIGHIAARMALSRLDTPLPESPVIIQRLPPPLIVRGSTASPAC